MVSNNYDYRNIKIKIVVQIKIMQIFNLNRIHSHENENEKYIKLGGWSWSWNHSALPGRWAPWHQSGGIPSSATGTQRGNSSNRGVPWGSSSSQRSWHPARQATTKYNR